MKDSFQARVDKVFGSLVSSPSPSSPSPSHSPSPSPSPSLSALWSLTDQEIEKKEWNRDKHDAVPDHVFFSKPSQGQIRNTQFPDFGELQDDEEPDPDEFNDKKKRKKHNPRSTDNEDFDIRSSIGLDCTLDYEDEEDVYDKVAVGREKSGDRLYMRDIVEYCGMDDNSHHELPTSFKNVARDNRANHLAAKLRLKEDAETAGNFGSLKLSEIAAQPASEARGDIKDNGVTPKPILKKREMQQSGRSAKRVRFQQEFVGTNIDSGEQSSPIELERTTSQEGADKLPPGEAKTTAEASGLPHYSTPKDCQGEPSTSGSIPDYVRNPSRYMRYTLNSSDDMDEESNRRACMDFLNLLKKPNGIEQEHSEPLVSSPKSLIFTPKKKESDTSIVRKDNEFKQNLADISKDKAFPVGIAAARDTDGEICPMEEDKPENLVDKSSSAQKPGRQYRARTIVDCNDE